ncbi:hypothetical protein [Methylopila sp. Yamaguchi]|uniref:hypothetical protein n=1 Tax=Methylopila sp. Yamaguchi TaxID=1437817 RepID=UPI0011AF41BE|nr:hypothetical protein [Methylopila sp. Yamaguchi]
MKSIVSALVLFAASAFAANAQTAQQRYQGTFFVTSASAACAAEPAAEVGDNFVFVFRTETTRQVFALFGTRRAMSYAPSTGARFATSGTHSSISIGGGAASTTFTGAYRSFVAQPATFATTTQTMSLRGTLTNFDGTAGCTITFTASGLRRPGF